MEDVHRRFVPILCLAATSCAPATMVERPAEITSSDWSTPAEPADGPVPLAEVLGSPELAALIAEARRASPALLATAAHVDEALALARAARVAGRPVVGAFAGGSVARRDVLGFTNSSVGLDASYGLDLAGERRARGRAAVARADAAMADREVRQIDAAAAIARVVIQRAALARRLALVDSGLAQAEKVQHIVDLRVREGAASRVDAGLQTIRVKRLEAERLRLQGALEQTGAALALLIGAEAPAFRNAPADLDGFAEPRFAAPSPLALAGTRPDLRAAEARLRAAGGDVAAARAAFFPRIDLSAGRIAGVAVSGGLNLGAALLAPIFNRGEVKGQYLAVSARQRAAALDYQQAVLAALAEVENALAASRSAAARGRVLTGLRREATITADLARRRYLEGEAGLQELLDAQDLTVAAEDAEVLAREERLEAAVALWRATATGPG